MSLFCSASPGAQHAAIVPMRPRALGPRELMLREVVAQHRVQEATAPPRAARAAETPRAVRLPAERPLVAQPVLVVPARRAVRPTPEELGRPAAPVGHSARAAVRQPAVLEALPRPEAPQGLAARGLAARGLAARGLAARLGRVRSPRSSSGRRLARSRSQSPVGFLSRTSAASSTTISTSSTCRPWTHPARTEEP